MRSWSIRGSRSLGIETLDEVQARYFHTTSKNGCERYFAFLRVGLPEWIDGLSGSDGIGRRTDYAAMNRQVQRVQNSRNLWSAVYRAGVEVYPIPRIRPVADRGRRYEGGSNPRFEFDYVWMLPIDVRSGKDEDQVANALEGLEKSCETMETIIASQIPDATVERLTKGRLTQFLEELWGSSPEERLPATIDAQTFGRLQPSTPSGPSIAQVRTTPEFFVPNAADSERGEISLGTLQSATGTKHHDINLALDDLVRHLVIVGATGTGKSSTAALIVEQVSAMGVPILILDWASEHSGFVNSLGGKVLTPGLSTFVLNPLENLLGREPDDHIADVSDIFSDIYHFSHPQKGMFEDALKLTMVNVKTGVPTIEALLETIEKMPLKAETTPDTKNALELRLSRLTRGAIGATLNGTSTISLEDLLGPDAGVISVDLGHIMNAEARNILASVLMKLVYEYRVTKLREGSTEGGPVLKHLLVIEEAKYLVPARDDEDFAAVGERMVEEMRKYGEGIVIISQDPTQLARSVIKNADIRAMFRLSAEEDLRTLGQVLNIDDTQAAYISNLRPGEAVLSMTRLARPVLVKVHELKAAKPEEAS